jgi:hypothetical protein
MDDFSVLKRLKVINVDSKHIIAARGYNLYRSFDKGKTWKKWTKLDKNKYSYFSRIRLLARLTRSEVTALYQLNEKDCIVIAKKGIYIFNNESNKFKCSFKVTKGSRPLALALDDNNYVYWGDYCNGVMGDINIYCSKNLGKNWEIVYSFPEKSIRHIHGIFYDKFENKLWFATGDEDGQCIIGYSTDNFRTVNTVFQGGQDVRTVKLFFFKEFIVYATDSPLAKNFIYRVDRRTLKRECVQDVQGSVVHGVQTDRYCVLSTTVEPTEVNKSNYSYLWFSENGIEWEEIFKGKKDVLHKQFFQYGCWTFPVIQEDDGSIYATGRSLVGFDNNTIIKECK